MKTLYTFLLLGLACYSCTEKAPTKEEIVKANAEAYTKEKLGDPESYEFVSLELLDSVTYKDNIELTKEQLRRVIESEEETNALYLEMKGDVPGLYTEEERQEVIAGMERNKRMLSAIDSLEVALGDNKNNVAAYTYLYKFRNVNGFGAKVLNQAYLQTNSSPDYKVIHLVMDKDKLLSNPNDFPGYQTVVERFKDR